MGKQKKTREQKIIADLRRKLDMQSKKEPTFEFKPSPQRPIQPSLITKTIAYPYLLGDLLKTITLTGAIVGAEIILFFLLKKQILLLPNISF